jgi:hypothetical protein
LIAEGEVGLSKRTVFTIVAAALTALVVSSVAVADPPATTLAGTSEWSTGMSGTTTTIHGTFGKQLGTGTYEGTLNGGPAWTTGSCGPICEDVTGTITFSTKHGTFTVAVQSDSHVALQDIASHSWRDFTLSLIVVGGTGSYARAHGTLALSYTSTWTHTWINGEFVDEVSDSGTLTGKLH